ncbi:hypothetical protein C9374_009908 [Naegleria lovaniensis]|uniref:HEAT repeat-containing protein 5B n=1 Tax=Naegleria lovaniensis TaxID=51637 RepID=A0AA88GCZ7_NAELO|nr:uncharacterized protein C9374_009908 [Naegleria lovaniensis]KAG2375285.1 hypothetical protein C9374_009908 [Naegleria lovaniensis]
MQCLSQLTQFCTLASQNKKINSTQQEQIYLIWTDLARILENCTIDKLDKNVEVTLMKSVSFLTNIGNSVLTRRLICRCFNKFYNINPSTLIPSGSSKIVQLLEQHSNTTRNPQKINEIACLLDILGEAYSIQSHLVPNLFNLINNNLFWKLWKLNDDPIKEAILMLCAKFVANSKKRVKNEWTEYLKLILKGTQETNKHVKIACGELMLSIAVNYARPSDVNLKVFDTSLNMCLKSMEDPEEEVRKVFSHATAQLLLSCMSDTGLHDSVANEDGVTPRSQKPSKEYTCSYAIMIATAPFTRIGQTKELRSAIASCIIYFFSKCPEDVIISNMDTIVKNLTGLISISSNNITNYDKKFAQTYVTKMLSIGLIDRLTEAGRIALLNNLVQLVINNTVVPNDSCFTTVLYCIGKLCKVLGESVAKYRDSILDAILQSLKYPIESVRYIGALTIKQLMEALPSHSTGLISALMNMVQIDHAELATASKRDENIKSYANSLHGHSCALAALIMVSAKHSLTISHALCSAVLDTASLLGKAAHKSADDLYVSTKRQESCWILVCAILSLNDYWVKNNLEKILELWDDTMSGKYEEPITYTTKEEEITYRLRSRACCLLSLQIFIMNCIPLLAPEKLNLIFGYVSATVDLLSSLPPTFKPTTSSGLYSINLIKMNLFNLVGKLPESVLAYVPSTDSKLQLPQHRHVINFVTKMAFAEADASISDSIPIRTSLIDSMVDLKVKLDPIEEKYASISVDSFDASCILFDNISNLFYSESIYLKLPSLTVRLVDSSIRVLGKLFTYHKPNSKAQIIEHLVQQVKTALANNLMTPPTTSHRTRLEEDSSTMDTTLCIFSNVVATIYCILRNLETKSEENKKHKFYPQIHSVLNAAIGFSDPFVRAAAAECMYSFGKIIGDILLEDVVKRCTQKITTSNASLKSGLALALGSVNRSVGTLKSRELLPSTVSFLIALSKITEEDVQRSAFLSLYHTIDTNGVAFAPHAETIIQCIFSLIFDAPHSAVSILTAVCKIMRGLIGLGPELLQLKTQPFDKIFNYFISDLMTSIQANSELFSSDALVIEFIHLLQRVIVFTPYLVENLETIVDFLKKLTHLKKERLYIENIQNEIGQCIKIICDQKPELISKYFTPSELFEVVDDIDFSISQALTYQSLSQSSSETYIAGNNQENHFKNIISSLISSKLISPKPWIDLIYTIIYSELRTLEKETSQSVMLGDTDEKDDTPVEKKLSEAQPLVYSWQTKVFAMKCLQQVIETYSDELWHVDLSVARKHPDKDCLVNHLSKIIDICCTATNKGTISVQHAGLVLMININNIFGKYQDPDVPTEPLLQQHALRFSTAISDTITQINSPLLVYASCQLASIFIPSRMLRNQSKLLSRMCSYLINYITDPKTFISSSQGEVTTCMVRISVLTSLAEIYVSAQESQNKDLLEILQPNMKDIFINWYNLLQDFSNLTVVVNDEEDDHILIRTSNEFYAPIYEQAVENLNNFYFVEPGTERNVLYYFKQSYAGVLNAIAVARGKEDLESTVDDIDYNDSLLIGLAISHLYGADKKNIDKSIKCIKSIGEIIATKQFQKHHHAPGAIFEVFLLLIEIQGIRHLPLHNACLDLLEKILANVNVSLFVSSDQVSTQAIVTTSTEVCLKPLRLHFPYLFKQDGEFEMGSFELEKDQKDLIAKSMSCLKTIVKTFGLSITGAVVPTLLYTACRVVQFTKSNLGLDTTTAIVEVSENLHSETDSSAQSMTPEEKFSIWSVAIRASIDNIISRLLFSGKTIYTPEIELLFIFLSSSLCSNIELHDKVVRNIIKALQNEINNMHDSTNDPKKISQAVDNTFNILYGLQNGILYLARSGLAKLAVFYSMSAAVDIVLNLSSESKYLVESVVDSSHTLDKIAPPAINILLAGFSLLSELNSPPASVQSYLCTIVPMLVNMTKFARDHKISKTFSLGVQCFDRLTKVAPDQFKSLITAQLLPPSVITDIQEFAKQQQQSVVNSSSTGGASTKKPIAASKPKKKLTMNF